jgi:hypothetical protein
LSAVRECLFGAYLRSYSQYRNVPSILNLRTRHVTVITDESDFDSTTSRSQRWRFASFTYTTSRKTFSVTSITGRSYPAQPLLQFCCWNTMISTRNISVHTWTRSKSHYTSTTDHTYLQPLFFKIIHPRCVFVYMER